MLHEQFILINWFLKTTRLQDEQLNNTCIFPSITLKLYGPSPFDLHSYLYKIQFKSINIFSMNLGTFRGKKPNQTKFSPKMSEYFRLQTFCTWQIIWFTKKKRGPIKNATCRQSHMLWTQCIYHTKEKG